VRLACSTATFPADRLEIALAKTAWAGFSGVELAVGGGDLPGEEELRERLRGDDLELAAVYAGVLPAGGASEAEGAMEQLTRIGRAAALARALDGSVLVVEAPAEGSLGELRRSLGLLRKALADLPIDVCVMNRAGTLLAQPDDLERLWEPETDELRPPGLALNPGQAALAGWDPLDLTLLWATPRHVYLNDAAGGRIVPPGDGTIDWPDLVAALAEAEFSGSLSLVLENADPWAVEPITREVHAVASSWLP